MSAVERVYETDAYDDDAERDAKTGKISSIRKALELLLEELLVACEILKMAKNAIFRMSSSVVVLIRTHPNGQK